MLGLDEAWGIVAVLGESLCEGLVLGFVGRLNAEGSGVLFGAFDCGEEVES